ncbi:MAG: hypothetical protein CM1200mP10_31070 [Candidatus Neomarinimicrobiota bacterium]|nr:MAG: hypothetical protein CM1200mP10_31070 [Candidatus Neomarinimicrobiota bacterium]
MNFPGEFILMAATLMRIKAKMLLPKPQLGDEDELKIPRKINTTTTRIPTLKGDGI